jgi:Na+-driven multidrug efflux pump
VGYRRQSRERWELIDQRRAEALAVHALAIGGVMAALLTLLPAILAWPTFRLPGGREEGLAPSVADARVLFGGAIAIWLTGMFAPIVRGTGNMFVPGVVMIAAFMLSIRLSGARTVG